MSYGAFVKLEPGIEGLVHISEMSWTKRINHPSELVADRRQDRGAGPEHQQGQAGNLAGHEAGPAQPVGQGRREVPAGHAWSRASVRNLTNYGAFIEIEEGIDGLLHVSDMSWTRKVGHPTEVVQKGEKVTCDRPQRRPGAQADRPGPQADEPTTRGRATSPAATSRARSRRARSPSSPTSASSSSWSRAWKACCTSPSWPTTRSRARRRSSRSATRSRSRSSASTPATARSACPARRRTGPSPTARKAPRARPADPAAPRPSRRAPRPRS